LGFHIIFPLSFSPRNRLKWGRYGTDHLKFSSNFSAPFIRRPIATSLISVAIFLSGVVAFQLLPTAPLPQVDFPTINVSAHLPGASPETMASAVATPLEHQFSRIASITQMTSTSQFGSTNITLQFDLNRNIDAAARDVQAAINAAGGQLPADLPSKPQFWKVNPADAPVMLISMTWRRLAVSVKFTLAAERVPLYVCRSIPAFSILLASVLRMFAPHSGRLTPIVRKVSLAIVIAPGAFPIPISCSPRGNIAR
jgi:hypothetical protein